MFSFSASMQHCTEILGLQSARKKKKTKLWDIVGQKELCTLPEMQSENIDSAGSSEATAVY